VNKTLYCYRPNRHGLQIAAEDGWEETPKTFRRTHGFGRDVVRKDDLNRGTGFWRFHETPESVQRAVLAKAREEVVTLRAQLARAEAELRKIEAAWPEVSAEEPIS
jgi:hypothetical protein